MLWVISCIDKPNSAALRAEHQKSHSAYLKSQDGIIFFSGPLQSDDGTENIGSLWVVNVNNRGEAKAFADGEAFTQAGVFASVTITRVRKGHLYPELADE